MLRAERTLIRNCFSPRNIEKAPNGLDFGYPRIPGVLKKEEKRKCTEGRKGNEDRSGISSRHDHLCIQRIVLVTFVTFCVNGFSPRKLTLLPFVSGLVFVAVSRVAGNNQDRSVGVLLCAIVVGAAGDPTHTYPAIARVILVYKPLIMKNIVSRVILYNYTTLAALGSFRLLFRRRTHLALLSPEGVFPSEQGSFLFDGRAFPCRLSCPKPGLSWGPGSDIRVAPSGRGFCAGVVVSSQAHGLDTGILFKR
jgi:hypothetical protein